MFGIHDFPLFLASCLLLNVTPGADFVYVLGRSAGRGLAAGVWASLGIGAGCFVHIAAAALGLSAILAASTAAFTAVKWVGAAYLIYVGISMLRQAAGLPELERNPSTNAGDGSLRKIFWQGFLTNALNPKVALFFLAFVPQFIDAASLSKLQAFLLLGIVFNTTGTIWNLFVAWAASALAPRFEMASRAGLWFNRCLGGVFIALGLRLAVAGRD